MLRNSNHEWTLACDCVCNKFMHFKWGPVLTIDLSFVYFSLTIACICIKDCYVCFECLGLHHKFTFFSQNRPWKTNIYSKCITRNCLNVFSHFWIQKREIWKMDIFSFFTESSKVFVLQRHTIFHFVLIL